MLGEVEIQPWQCIAELVDNAIDGYDTAPDEWREKYPKMRVDVILPSLEDLNKGKGIIEVRDHGYGMTKGQLQDSVRAGWSGNEGYDRLGLFGMGFNIATAKLGKKTRVLTGKEKDKVFEWIDIDPLAMMEHAKKNSEEKFMAEDGQSTKEVKLGDQGTIIRIESLKPDNVRPLIDKKITSKDHIRQRLGRIYSPLMEKFDLDIRIHTETSPPNGHPVVPWKHCIWNEKKFTDFKEYKSTRREQIKAVEHVNIPLQSQPYCNNCWEWFDKDVSVNDCPSCNATGSVERRRRVIQGWIGVQRFFSSTRTKPYIEHYGIDLVRNGRVIEELAKDFFTTIERDGTPRPDYPVEAQQQGRIVGSLDISFCPCDFRKGKFNRDDPNWALIMNKIQGNGLRPKVTEDDGKDFIPTNLNRMTRAWGSAKVDARNPPGMKNLIPGEVVMFGSGKGRKPKLVNDLPTLKGEFTSHHAFAKKFWANEKGYLDDEKWMEGVLFAQDFDSVDWYEQWKIDNGVEDEPDIKKCKHDRPQKKCKYCKDKFCRHENFKTKCNICKKEISDDWVVDHELSGEYKIRHTKEHVIRVDAYIDQSLSRKKSGSTPLEIRRQTKDHYRAIFSHQHEMFANYKENPMDYLLMEIASTFVRLNSNIKGGLTISDCYMQLKQDYCDDEKLDLESVKKSATKFLEGIRSHALGWDIDASTKEQQLQDMVISIFERENLEAKDAKEALKDGTFVNYIPPHTLFEHVLHQRITDLTDGDYFSTIVRKSSSSGTRTANTQDLLGALRLVCSAEGRNEATFEDLQAIQNAIKRLEGWMA